jgi:hypothetical protein
MKPKTSPQEHINKLNEFRQAIYAHGLKKRRDAQFELIDALLMQAKVGAFPELTLSLVFRRQWSSAYKAIGTGTQDRTWLTRYLSQQVPEAGSSWALPVDSRRVTAAADAVMTGMQQIDALLDARRDAGLAGLIVIATDGKYSNQACNRACAKRGGIAKVGRMRCDRTLYREPRPYPGRGTKQRKHGAPFKFKDPATWGAPVEDIAFEHHKFGTVRLRRWQGLHAKQDADVTFSVIRCETHLERETPPDPIWLEYLGPDGYRAKTIWGWFQRRYPIEPQNRFRKQYLNWITPRFQTTARCDRWTALVDIAYWQLFLMRDWVQDCPLPWQAPQVNPTPERVLQSLGAHFTQLGTPAKPPMTRGKSPGWPKGRPRDPPKRYQPVKRSHKTA